MDDIKDEELIEKPDPKDTSNHLFLTPEELLNAGLNPNESNDNDFDF